MAWRYALAAPLLVAAAGPRTVFRTPPDRALALVLLGGGGQTLVTWLSLSALEWMPAASLGFLFYTYPAWVAVFAALSGTERLTPLRLGAISLALLGITLMVGAPWALTLPLPGVLRALGAAVIYALYIPLLHRLRGPLDASAASAWIVTGAALVFLGLAMFDGTLVAAMTPAGWVIALAMAVYCTVIAFVTFLKGLAVLGPVRSAILSTAEPFFTAVLAALILSQPLGPSTVAGGACVVSAILLLQRRTPAAADAPLPT
jgi:drug/metabolite transporter (DMT)-like permease